MSTRGLVLADRSPCVAFGRPSLSRLDPMTTKTRRTRYEVKIVPAADTALTADAVPAVSATPRFHVLIIVEGVLSTDGREFHNLSWRDLPLPLMGVDKTTWGHEDAVLIGNIDTIEKQGVEIHGWGSYIAEPDEDAAHLIDMVQSGELRGLSADIEVIEAETLVPVPTNAEGDTVGEIIDWTDDPVDNEPTETDENGQKWVVVKDQTWKMRCTEGRIMGATVVPFPAYPEAFIEPDGEQVAPPALAAGGAKVLARYGVTGAVLVAAGATGTRSRFSFPAIPPRSWFEEPEHDGPTPLTITDDGQVYGHLALWGECHIGFAGQCVEPPQSATNYARFHVGEVPTDDGTRVETGRLTFSTGHAPLAQDHAAALAHYDNTGTVAADVVASDGEWGIWLAGAARPDLTEAQVREVMASPPSGDWRRFGRSLELVGALCVNVPGFNTPRASFRREEGLVASLVVSHPASNAGKQATSTVAASGLPDDVADTVIEVLAESVGRGTASRVAALRASVHGGQ